MEDGIAKSEPLDYTLSGESAPYSIDIVFKDGPAAGIRMLGLIRIDENGELMTAFAPQGQSRPAGFDSRSGSGVIFQRYRRVE